MISACKLRTDDDHLLLMMAFDRLITANDKQTRHLLRLLARLMVGEPPYPEPKSIEPSDGKNWAEKWVCADLGSPRHQ
jgi:hypothetical protein